MNFDSIAHDLKTPLATLLGTARLMGTENLSPDARRRLAVIEAQVRRMSLLIDSYLVGGDDTETIGEEDAAGIVVEATRELEPLFERAGIALCLQFEQDIPRCRCARAALHRVVVNLVKNAIDAMPNGGSITCRMGTSSGRDVFIEVSDNGIGMPAAVLARAFEVGFTTKAADDGHGLGLAISRELVRGQGGDISISSEPGRGTRVVVTLPAATTVFDAVESTVVSGE
jgi:signal transduction histidine kinase